MSSDYTPKISDYKVQYRAGMKLESYIRTFRNKIIQTFKASVFAIQAYIYIEVSSI